MDDLFGSSVTLTVEHHGDAATLHDGADIRKVEVDEAGQRDGFDDALDNLGNQLVHDAEGLIQWEIGNVV